MVVFTCNHCGESLQKPKVEKHYSFVCRRPKNLTCVDCLKDFRGEEFAVHIKCVSEEQRYAAKGSITNLVKKGEAKQESWMEMIRSILDTEKNLSHSHRNLLNTMSSYNNVPRKKIKFINFIKNSSGGRVNLNDAEVVWDIIEKYKSEVSKTNENKNENNENLKDLKNIENDKKRKLSKDGQEPPKKKKVEKEIDSSEENAEAIVEGYEKFSFQEKILEILTAKGSMSVKKLQKKVLNAYLKHSGESECTPKCIKKYNKKLKKIENLEFTEDTVTLKLGSEQ